ncbi:MAG: OmpA family protein [Phycisphaerae bacterium]|nr:OmpA family protein [Phycisphaerae bacterium]
MADEKHGDAHDDHKSHKSHGSHGGGHGGGHEEAHEGAPEWLISFADNVALLMGFFVILLAMNMKEPTHGGIGGKEKHGTTTSSANPAMLDLVISMREAFNNPIDASSTDPREALLIQRIREKKEGDAKTKGPPGDRQEVQTVRPTDYHRIGGVVTFEEGAVAVDDAGMKTAARVAQELKGRRTIIEIRGHASLSEASNPLDKGMTLSFDRALAVAQQLRLGGLDWDQMRTVAVGAGDRVKPLARSAQEHHNNQRVEIIITDEQIPADPYAKDPNAAGSAGTMRK